MKKLLTIIFVVLLSLTGCGKKADSTSEIILKHYSTILKTNDTALIRNEVSELKNLSQNQNLSEDERMLAQYTYNVAYGIAKLSLSGKSISAFDFPEMEMLSATVAAIAKNELELTSTMVTESAKFLQKVENFIK